MGSMIDQSVMDLHEKTFKITDEKMIFREILQGILWFYYSYRYMCINNLETNRRLSVSRLPVSKLPISTAKLNYSLRSIISVGVLVQVFGYMSWHPFHWRILLCQCWQTVCNMICTQCLVGRLFSICDSIAFYISFPNSA
jgi:hypothetical protein